MHGNNGAMAGDFICANCGINNFARNTLCFKCGCPKEQSVAPEPTPPPVAVTAEGGGGRWGEESSEDGSQGMDDTLEDLHTLTPLNMYGYSKHMFDCYAQRMGWDKQIVGLKYYNVFGPNEAHKDDMRSLVAKSYEQIQATGEIGLFKSYHPDYTDGNQMRDFLYVKDAVAMTIHLANTPSANGLFNLGSGQANTWNTLATAIFAALDLEPNIKYIEMPEQLKGKYQYYTCADTTKLRSTGYTAEGYTLQDSVKDYVQNYLVTGNQLGQETS